MTIFQRIYLLILGILVSIVSIALLAQEKPARPMRSWQLGWLPLVDRTHEGEFRVDVFDTEGVCLYIVSGQRFKEEARGTSGVSDAISDALALSQAVAMTAVSKKDLPPGTGCQ